MEQNMICEGEAVKNLQKYLRELSYYDDRITPVPIDGIFENATKCAVKDFQKLHSLPENGIVDKKTWDSIYKSNKECIKNHAEPEGIFPCPYGRSGFCIEKNERSDLVMIVQIMLNTLKMGYDDFGDIEVNGVCDETTQNAVRHFQKCNFLPQTGLVDTATWNRLASGYNMYVKKD